MENAEEGGQEESMERGEEVMEREGLAERRVEEVRVRVETETETEEVERGESMERGEEVRGLVEWRVEGGMVEETEVRGEETGVWMGEEVRGAGMEGDGVGGRERVEAQ